MNTLLCFLFLNFIFFLLFRIDSLFTKNVIFKKYSNVNFALLYPNMSISEIDNLLKETWSRSYEYEPFTQFKESPCNGYYVNVDKNGFRYTKNQGTWPPASKTINVFLFGGSTTFGYGVPDNQTIASYLQEYLTQKLGHDVRVYNFGRGYYYLTQERLLYEQLLKSGFVPDLAIFIDGINDFAFNNNEPIFTDRLRELFATRTVDMMSKLISMTSLGQAAGIVQDKIASLFPKEKIKELHELQRSDSKKEKSCSSVKDDKVINRYLFDKKLIEAASNIMGVKSVFILQPNPFYDYDKSYFPFLDEESSTLEHCYLHMANFIREHPMGNNFIWCADIQRDLKQPLYVDQIHYSASFSKIFAEVIANQLVEKFNLKKRSDPLIVDHN